MSPSNSKCSYSNNCLHFLKCALPLQNSPLQNKKGNKFYDVIKGKIVFVTGQYKLILTDKAITEKNKDFEGWEGMLIKGRIFWV